MLKWIGDHCSFRYSFLFNFYTLIWCFFCNSQTELVVFSPLSPLKDRVRNDNDHQPGQEVQVGGLWQQQDEQKKGEEKVEEVKEEVQVRTSISVSLQSQCTVLFCILVRPNCCARILCTVFSFCPWQ